MVTKKTKGYTKSNVGKFDLYSMLTSDVFKDKNEPFEQWFNRKITEGMDEQVKSRNGVDQNPNPSV